MTTPTESTLKAHFELCEEVYLFMIEENKLLKKQNEEAFRDSFLGRKRELLSRLEESTADLKGVNQKKDKLNEASRNLVQQALNRMMKIFFLDRENEQLLLKANLKNNVPEPVKPVTTQRIKKLYQNNVSPVPRSEEVLSPNAPSSLFDPHA